VPADVYATSDAVAVRFFAPDTGGVAHPRFITHRQLSFEAKLLALEEDPAGVLQTRHVRAAIESHVADEMLASLPVERAPSAGTLVATVDAMRAGVEQRAGGHAVVEHALAADGIDATEFAALLQRQARAALYLDRALTPILTYTEDQLRETYRTTSHPFRARRFEECRDDLARWLLIERFRSAEQTYLQTARSRVTITYL
jgi:polysaccharide pyruvyl transferase WcaK-like protein